eukprot:TRINITY_DN2917_c0_g1_i1.p1 TRINITY_DN2917_c0_g1~~TRINITY_DN2917_c0_g1_i1.p1  ORF type:complete len:350 (+),score=29.86 TRINITY_DN2917_c0_g1_i1:75-1124(+)
MFLRRARSRFCGLKCRVPLTFFQRAGRTSWQRPKDDYQRWQGESEQQQHEGGDGGKRSTFNYKRRVFSNDIVFFVRVVVIGGVTYLIVFQIYKTPVPFTGRNQLVLLSRKTEKRIGEMSYRSALKNYHEHILPPNHHFTQQVRSIGQRIIQANPICRDPKYEWKWSFTVIDSREANAFVVPGGQVVVFTGLLKVLKSPDQLAAVLSHEIGHTIARHSAETILIRVLSSLGSILLGAVVGDMNIASSVSNLLINLPHSRKFENEADVIGLHMMARAGIRLSATIEMFKILESVGAHAPTLLSTHPSNKQRIQHMKKMIPIIQQEYAHEFDERERLNEPKTKRARARQINP